MNEKPTVTLTYRGKAHQVPVGMTVRDAVKKIGLQPETVLAVVGGKLITDDTVLRAGMEIRLVAVISGGAV
jgi:sulfur carrier protein ThiS